MKQLKIDQHDVKLSKIPAKMGWEILHDLGRVIGPAVAEAADDNIKGALDHFFKSSSPQELYFFVEKCAPLIIVDGENLQLDNYGLVMKCIKELLHYNFEDFFSPLVAALNDM